MPWYNGDYPPSNKTSLLSSQKRRWPFQSFIPLLRYAVVAGC